MINNNPYLLPVFRTDKNGDRIVKSPCLTADQWAIIQSLIKEDTPSQQYQDSDRRLRQSRDKCSLQ